MICRTLLLQDIPLPDNGGPFANDSNAPGKPGEPPQDEDEIVAINEKGNNKFDNSSIDEDFASGLMSYSFGETSSIHNRLVQHNGPSFLEKILLKRNVVTCHINEGVMCIQEMSIRRKVVIWHTIMGFVHSTKKM
jgi:hypothetical protein